MIRAWGFLTLLFLQAFISAAALSDFYWEEPELFSMGSFPVTASSAQFSVAAWQESTAQEPGGGTAGGSISIALAVKSAGGEWERREAAGGPYPYLGGEPSILSIVIDRRGRIIIAAAASTTETEILISKDRGYTFSRRRVNLVEEGTVAPRIFVRADGGYLLFTARGRDQTMSIYYSRSNNAETWTPFEPFVRDSGLQLNFLPAHGFLGKRDFVFFQTFSGDNVPAFQLYFKTSDNGGATWSAAQRFTVFNDPVMNTDASPDRFDNQRAFILRQRDGLRLVWERRYGSQQPQIYTALIDSGGNMIGEAERVNSGDAYCNNPLAFLYEGSPTVIWFDNRRGTARVFMAQRANLDWQNFELPGVAGEASFARAVVDSDGLSIFWQSVLRGSGRIFKLEPDRSVLSPKLTAVNFTQARPSRQEKIGVSWNVPADTSGIFGFSWSWSQSEDEVPPEQVMVYNTGGKPQSLEVNAVEDGPWFFSVRAQDFAGNWSVPARVKYIRDTTPPAPAVIVQPDLDENGFLLSSTLTLEWEPPEPDLTGYTWNLQYAGETVPEDGESPDVFPAPELPLHIMGTNPAAVYRNLDDGVWNFTIAAIDEAGNIGEYSNIIFKTNKFIPYTSVGYIDSFQDDLGILRLRISGRGFSTNGNITRIFLDRDGRLPYDAEFSLDAGDYRIGSDREIDGLAAGDLEEGKYRLILEHSGRGFYTSGALVSVDRRGVVKFGDYSGRWEPSWSVRPARRWTFGTELAVFITLLILALVGLAVSVRGIGGVIAESAAVKADVIALITGDFMPLEKKKRAARIKKRGIGLRFKLALYASVLVLLVVVMISTPLYYMMTRTQRETLLRGIWDRSTVLLEGIATSARAYLPSRNVLELSYLPSQMNALPEARYVTITGYGTGSTIFNDHVWASNDPDILAKIDTPELQPGVSRLTDVLSPSLEKTGAELNERARAEVGDISRTIAELNQEGLAIATRLDEESQRRLGDIQVAANSLETRLTRALAEIAGQTGSEPAFSTGDTAPGGIRLFFKPVMFRQGSDDNYFRGLIRLEVSLDSIAGEIASGRDRLLRTIFIIAFAALAMGAAGALILASLIIRPLRSLVRHVEIIRDTGDKAKLAGLNIRITSRDEIAILGETVNDMTHGLVKAAIAANDLSIGKEIQKKFIPLELDRDGNKLTSGCKDTPAAHFFGYYEGAKGVSGDYFDYLDLDGRYYAIIKCDVAGKGIPAALIMIQVATMFLNHFKQWKPTGRAMHIEDAVYQINDFIETLAFKGRFAAFTLCLFDSETGVMRFCNAGDNIIHIFDASEACVKTITLPQTPAAGVLPNMLVESKGGYQVQTFTLDRGDILLLYTDGIEEAKRKFRDSSFNEIVCAGDGGTQHGNHTAGQEDEELGPDRVEGIINAVMRREIYRLRKWHNPEGDRELQFDFSDCEGTVEEVIMALVSVEKMFRCYRNPQAGGDSRVLVDKKADEFLKAHFLQYREYCADTREYPGNDAYMYYTHINEDEQYDDLTILGIKRK